MEVKNIISAGRTTTDTTAVAVLRRTTTGERTTPTGILTRILGMVAVIQVVRIVQLLVFLVKVDDDL